MTDLERVEAAALSQQITLEQYARQVLRDPGGYSRRTVAAVREWRGYRWVLERSKAPVPGRSGALRLEWGLEGAEVFERVLAVDHAVKRFPGSFRGPD